MAKYLYLLPTALKGSTQFSPSVPLRSLSHPGAGSPLPPRPGHTAVTPAHVCSLFPLILNLGGYFIFKIILFYFSWSLSQNSFILFFPGSTFSYAYMIWTFGYLLSEMSLQVFFNWVLCLFLIDLICFIFIHVQNTCVCVYIHI